MIFVTVGTHEQPFNRLIEYIDKLKEEEVIKEEVVMQTGYSTYEPKYCIWSKLISYKDMIKNIKEARIVITHGGPASFIMPLQEGKIPIVVPRQFEFGEHVNNHQLEFSKEVSVRMKNIIPIYNIEDLKDAIINYDKKIKTIKQKNLSNNNNFCEKFEKIVCDLIKESD